MAPARRSWRKLYLGINADTGQIVAPSLTAKEVDDGAAVGALLDRITDPVAAFITTLLFAPNSRRRLAAACLGLPASGLARRLATACSNTLTRPSAIRLQSSFLLSVLCADRGGSAPMFGAGVSIRRASPGGFDLAW